MKSGTMKLHKITKKDESLGSFAYLIRSFAQSAITVYVSFILPLPSHDHMASFSAANNNMHKLFDASSVYAGCRADASAGWSADASAGSSLEASSSSDDGVKLMSRTLPLDPSNRFVDNGFSFTVDNRSPPSIK